MEKVLWKNPLPFTKTKLLRKRHHDKNRTKKLKNFKEGGNSVSFQTFDGSYGNVDKVLTFIQQFNASSRGEVIETSKLCNVVMHLTKLAHHQWSTLCAQNQASRMWKVYRITIMKQFLDDDAEDDVLTSWHSLTLKENESLQSYIEKFWDICLKVIMYKNISFLENK